MFQDHSESISPTRKPRIPSNIHAKMPFEVASDPGGTRFTLPDSSSHPLHPIYSSAALSAAIFSAPSVPTSPPLLFPLFQGSLYCGIISFCSSPRLQHFRHISDLARPRLALIHNYSGVPQGGNDAQLRSARFAVATVARASVGLSAD